MEEFSSFLFNNIFMEKTIMENKTCPQCKEEFKPRNEKSKYCS